MQIKTETQRALPPHRKRAIILKVTACVATKHKLNVKSKALGQSHTAGGPASGRPRVPGRAAGRRWSPQRGGRPAPRPATACAAQHGGLCQHIVRPLRIVGCSAASLCQHPSFKSMGKATYQGGHAHGRLQGQGAADCAVYLKHEQRDVSVPRGCPGAQSCSRRASNALRHAVVVSPGVRLHGLRQLQVHLRLEVGVQEQEPPCSKRLKTQPVRQVLLPRKRQHVFSECNATAQKQSCSCKSSWHFAGCQAIRNCVPGARAHACEHASIGWGTPCSSCCVIVLPANSCQQCFWLLLQCILRSQHDFCPNSALACRLALRHASCDCASHITMVPARRACRAVSSTAVAGAAARNYGKNGSLHAASGALTF